MVSSINKGLDVVIGRLVKEHSQQGHCMYPRGTLNAASVVSVSPVAIIIALSGYGLELFELGVWHNIWSLEICCSLHELHDTLNSDLP